mgnify:FL=1
MVKIIKYVVSNPSNVSINCDGFSISAGGSTEVYPHDAANLRTRYGFLQFAEKEVDEVPQVREAPKEEVKEEEIEETKEEVKVKSKRKYIKKK